MRALPQMRSSIASPPPRFCQGRSLTLPEDALPVFPNLSPQNFSVFCIQLHRTIQTGQAPYTPPADSHDVRSFIRFVYADEVNRRLVFAQRHYPFFINRYSEPAIFTCITPCCRF